MRPPRIAGAGHARGFKPLVVVEQRVAVGSAPFERADGVAHDGELQTGHSRPPSVFFTAHPGARGPRADFRPTMVSNPGGIFVNSILQYKPIGIQV